MPLGLCRSAPVGREIGHVAGWSAHRHAARVENWMECHEELRRSLDVLVRLSGELAAVTDVVSGVEGAARFLRCFDAFLMALATHGLFEDTRLFPFMDAVAGVSTSHLRAAHAAVNLSAGDVARLAGDVARGNIATEGAKRDPPGGGGGGGGEEVAAAELLEPLQAVARRVRALRDQLCELFRDEEESVVPAWLALSPAQYAVYRGRYCQDPAYEEADGAGGWRLAVGPR